VSLEPKSSFVFVFPLSKLHKNKIISFLSLGCRPFPPFIQAISSTTIFGMILAYKMIVHEDCGK